MAGIGTGTVHLPRHCDKRPVESFTPLNPCRLAAQGCFLLPGAVSRWRLGDCVLTIVVEHVCRVSIAIDDGAPIGVGIVRQGRLGQLLFVCPGCMRWRRSLYAKAGALACRRCNRLDYRSRHEARYGAARAVNLASKLRRKLGADPTPFSPLPPPPQNYWSRTVYDRLTREIAMFEAQAVAAFTATLAAVERRARSKRVHR